MASESQLTSFQQADAVNNSGGPANIQSSSPASTPLHNAARNGIAAEVAQLLAAGAPTELYDDQGATPLLWASQQGHHEVVRLLLDYGASVEAPDSEGWRSIHWASQNSHDLVVQLLLQHGALAEVQDGNGVRPLHLGAQSGNARVVSLLLQAVDVIVDTVADEARFTPLYMAARRGHLEIVELLLKAGASISTPIGQGFTALHAASEQGHIRVVHMLLKRARGAAAAAATNHGSTPLHLAAWSGHAEVCSLLLSMGGQAKRQIMAEDSQGWTPLYLAARCGHHQTVNILLQQLSAAATETLLSRAAKTAAAAGHMTVFAMLAKQLGRLHPTAVPLLLVGADAPSGAAALQAMIALSIADTAALDEEKVEREKARKELECVKAGVQHLIVHAAGMLKQSLAGFRGEAVDVDVQVPAATAAVATAAAASGHSKHFEEVCWCEDSSTMRDAQ